MTSILAEQPVVTAGLVLLIAIALVYRWMQTGSPAILIAGLVSLLLIPGAFILASYWVTDSELIRDAITRTATAVNNNDFERAIEIIDPSRRQQIDNARADLSRFRFDDARVNSIRAIDVIPGSVPTEAEVDMTAAVIVSDKGGQFSNLRVLRRIVLQFQKSADGKWYVIDYNHMPIIGATDGFSPQP